MFAGAVQVLVYCNRVLTVQQVTVHKCSVTSCMVFFGIGWLHFACCATVAVDGQQPEVVICRHDPTHRYVYVALSRSVPTGSGG
jgi:hypothetical protein